MENEIKEEDDGSTDLIVQNANCCDNVELSTPSEPNEDTSLPTIIKIEEVGDVINIKVEDENFTIKVEPLEIDDTAIKEEVDTNPKHLDKNQLQTKSRMDSEIKKEDDPNNVDFCIQDEKCDNLDIFTSLESTDDVSLPTIVKVEEIGDVINIKVEEENFTIKVEPVEIDDSAIKEEI
ncbi:hypothetical protein ILUMI_01978, partial [Ignelater luminosus]